MKFKKGSKVEVLNNREVPSGSWWSAEIISGGGHNYNVRYYCYSPDSNITVEKVPKKAIRPCPPFVGPQSWVPGDIVEVFEKNSWKLAEVSRVVDGSYFFVRLLGSSRQFRAHVSNLRVRQAWRNNKWVVIPKDCGDCSKEISSGQPKEGIFFNQIPQSCADDDTGFREPYLVSSRSKKRSRGFCPAPTDTRTRVVKKMKEVKDEGRHAYHVERCSSHLLEKGPLLEAFKACHKSKMMVASVTICMFWNLDTLCYMILIDNI